MNDEKGDAEEIYDGRIAKILRKGRAIRSVGFDDATFIRESPEPVGLAGVVCADDRFEGMVWGQITRDGRDATEVICELLVGSKFLPQLHVILLDGVAVGGFNVIDVPEVSVRLNLPVMTVMRARPNWPAIEAALCHVDDSEERLATMKRAGPVKQGGPIYFQSQGLSSSLARKVLARLTRNGHIPEPVRMAHLIAGAVATGESPKRA